MRSQRRLVRPETKTYGIFNSLQGLNNSNTPAFDPNLYSSTCCVADYSGGRVFASNVTGNHINVMDYTDPTQQLSSFQATINPYQIKIDELGGRIFISNYDVSTEIYDYNTLALIGSIPERLSINIGVEIDRAGNRIFVVESNVISIYDYTTLSYLSELTGFSSPRNMVIDSVNNRIFITEAVTKKLTIRQYSDPTIFIESITFVDSPWGVDLDLPNNHLYIGFYSNNTVKILNATTYEEIQTIGSPEVLLTSPRSIFYDKESSRLFISSNANTNSFISILKK